MFIHFRAERSQAGKMRVVWAALLSGISLVGWAGCDRGAMALEPVPVQREEPRTVDQEQPDYIRVDIRGTLRQGVIAIGGETTGTTISAGEITWELDLQGDEQLGKKAELLHGKQVLVRGTLERRSGVEIPERWIVTVESLAAA